MTTKHVVADDQLGQIARRWWEVNRRLMEGTLNPTLVAHNLQVTIEGVRADMSNPYSDEEMESNFTYPSEYTGHKSIREQVEALLAIPDFKNLDAQWALNKGQDWYDGLSLPDWVEGPLVYVWYEAFGGYHATLEKVLKLISGSRKFSNYRKGQLNKGRLRQHYKTIYAESSLKKHQPGDLIIVPSQAGLRHRGLSVRQARVRFDLCEFGLGSVAEGCRILTHPERFVCSHQLYVDCAGDEFDNPDSDARFNHTPHFRFLCGKVEFATLWFDIAYNCYGSASGFLLQ